MQLSEEICSPHSDNTVEESGGHLWRIKLLLVMALFFAFGLSTLSRHPWFRRRKLRSRCPLKGVTLKTSHLRPSSCPLEGVTLKAAQLFPEKCDGKGDKGGASAPADNKK